MTSKGLQRIFATVTDLPSMPASGIRMLKLLENPEASVDEIEDILLEAVMGKVADWVDELSDVLTFN